MCLVISACLAGVRSISASVCFLWLATHVNAPSHVKVRQAHQHSSWLGWSLLMTLVWAFLVPFRPSPGISYLWNAL